MVLPSILSVASHCKVALALSILLMFAPSPAPVMAGTAQLPPLPDWARGPDYHGKGQWEEFSVHAQWWNQKTVDAANQQGQRFDFLLYGDRWGRPPTRASAPLNPPISGR